MIKVFIVLEFLIERRPHIKWEFQTWMISNKTEQSHFMSRLCHPYWALVSSQIFTSNSLRKKISSKWDNISYINEKIVISFSRLIRKTILITSKPIYRNSIPAVFLHKRSLYVNLGKFQRKHLFQSSVW